MIRRLQFLFLLFFSSFLHPNIGIGQNNCDSKLLQEIHDDFEDRFRRFDVGSDFSPFDSLYRSIPEDLERCNQYFRTKLWYANLINLRYRPEDALPIITELLIDERFKDNSELQAELFLSISPIYSELNQTEKADHYIENADSIINKNKLSYLKAPYLAALAKLRWNSGDRYTAKMKAKKCISLARKVEDKTSESRCSEILIFGEPNLQKALNHGRRARNLYLEQEYYFGAAAATLDMAHRLANKSMYDSVRVHVLAARSYLEKMPTKYKEYYNGRMREAWYSTMGYEQEGDYKKALDWHKAYAKYLNLSAQVKNQEKIDRIDVEKDLKIKESELSSVSSRFRKNQTFTYLILGFLAFSLLLGYLLFRNRTQLNRANNQMREKNEQLNQLLEKHAILLSEVHHRVKNNLQNIISLIFFQKEKLKDHESKKYLENLRVKFRALRLYMNTSTRTMTLIKLTFEDI